MKKFLILLVTLLSITIIGCGKDYAPTFKEAERDFANGYYESARKKYQLVFDESTNKKLRSDAQHRLTNYDYKVEMAIKEKRQKELYATKINVAYDNAMRDAVTYYYSHCYVGNDLNFVVVYISPNWFDLNQGYKEAFVKKTLGVYLDVLDSYNITINTNQLSFLVKNPITDKTVASWGNIRGINIR